MTLTEQQRAATEAPERFVMVEAGPGCGKSTLLAERAAFLIECGVLPRDILVLTFTRSGASSIRRKVQEATEQEPRCETFHSYAASILKEVGMMANLQIATEFELEVCVRGLYEGGARLPKANYVGISKLKKAMTDYESGKHEVHGPEAGAMATLMLRLQEMGRRGLFDLMPVALDFLEEPRFAHVLIDEGQDVCPNEETMAVRSAPSLFVVRDKAQAIMQFRGAIDDAFESLKPTRYPLRESFRFGPEIAEAVNVVGRRIGVADVVGLGEPGSVVGVDSDLMPAPTPESMYLSPTNIGCEEIVVEWLRLGHGSIHIQRDPMGDPLGQHQDPFDAAREMGCAAVSTFHSARGRESERVIVTGLKKVKDGRLAYVALSRAKRHLVIVEAS